MSRPLSRREFVRVSMAGGGALLAAGSLAGEAEPPAVRGLCVTVCNHWSYIGIGWQLGIESCVLSVTDASEMADRPPHVKTCINLDARAYELIAQKFPEVADRLRRHLAEGKLELIGGTYGQPMGTTIGGESNIRQIVIGRETIRKALGYEMVTFLEEEEFTHPQIPQIASLAGFRYASLAQLDTWGRAGIPVLELNAVAWKGIDGTAIPSVPKNALFGHPPDLKKLGESPAFRKLEALGKPLLFTWEEFGWESHEHPAYLDTPARYEALARQGPVEFVTLKEYLDKYGPSPKETVLLPMDAWTKSLTWGLGGDQVRVMDRKVEGLLLGAELFDAVAADRGMASRAEDLEMAWKDLLASQSHDVGLCEFSRWQGDRMAPLDRVEDLHALTWGAIGYRHLDAALDRGRESLEASLAHLSARIDTGKRGPLAVAVFNPLAGERTDIVIAARVQPLPPQTRGLAVRDRDGRLVPSQVVDTLMDREGNLTVAKVAFLAGKVPPAGYDTYSIEPAAAGEAAPPSTLRIDERELFLENEHLRAGIDPATGAVASLLHKGSGRDALDGKRGAFPRFTGRPNPNLSLTPNPPAGYDSAGSKARIDWVERGPLRATVRARHQWPYLAFETRVTLAAGMPHVEVVTRVLARVPPHSDRSPPDIEEGYWISFAPSFAASEVVRDYPLAVEPTKNPSFHALTFVDLMGDGLGLLLLHGGTQYFKRRGDGTFSNLLMREWESHFTREYGWPVYAEYRHALMPHAPGISNAERLRAAAAFSRPLQAVVTPSHGGELPPAKGFIRVTPRNVELSAFRKLPGGGYELRVVEVEGQSGDARIELGLPFTSAVETDLLGRKLGEVERRGGALSFPIGPWKIRTFRIT